MLNLACVLPVFQIPLPVMVFGWTLTLNPQTPRCLPFTCSHPKYCKQNVPFCLAQRIWTIAENNAEKFKILKFNLSNYHYSDSLIKQGFQKALSILQKDIYKKPSNESILLFITIFNPKNPNIYYNIKSLVNCLKNTNISSFHNIKLMQSKCQSPNLKKLLTKAEFREDLSGTFNCSNKRCECCNYLLINDYCTFKNVQITFILKHCFTCNSFNLMYVVICDTCKEEYIGETGERKTKLRDRVRVYP